MPSSALTHIPPEIWTRDPLRQVAHPYLLTYFDSSNKSKQFRQQCPENARSHPETNSEQSSDDQSQSEESGSIPRE
jgi:hypothetical protein